MKCAVLLTFQSEFNAGLTLMSSIQYTCGSKNFHKLISQSYKSLVGNVHKNEVNCSDFLCMAFCLKDMYTG